MNKIFVSIILILFLNSCQQNIFTESENPLVKQAVKLVLTKEAEENLALQSKINYVLKNDTRNAGVKVEVYFGNYENKSLVYDLKNISGNNSMADVFRVFLQFADITQNETFDSINLSFRGKTKFVLSGSDFKIIGQEYSWQNPIYTIRTFPEKLSLPDGQRAFSVWEGGWLGVSKAQMEDFNKFHEEWYMNELIMLAKT